MKLAEVQSIAHLIATVRAVCSRFPHGSTSSLHCPAALSPILDALNAIGPSALGYSCENPDADAPPPPSGDAPAAPMPPRPPPYELVRPRRASTASVAHEIRYVHLAEESPRPADADGSGGSAGFSVGLFVFPPGATIPLHDHPRMSVLSRLVHGEVRATRRESEKGSRRAHARALARSRTLARSLSRARSIFAGAPRRARSVRHAPPPRRAQLHVVSYDWVDDPGAAPSGSAASWRMWPSLWGAGGSGADAPGGARVRLARRRSAPPCAHGDSVGGAWLRAPSTATLAPREGNVHAFAAGARGAAVLDVIVPPYDDERECTYYAEDCGARVALRARDDGSDAETVCLRPVEPPAEFSVTSAEFEVDAEP